MFPKALAETEDQLDHLAHCKLASGSSMIGQCRNDATVKMAKELQEVVAARQSDLGMTRLDGHGAEARGGHEALGVEHRGELGRIEIAARHPGMRTGSCSMPRTKLE